MIPQPFLSPLFLEEEESCDSADYESDVDSDDSDRDPTYCVVEEKFAEFSKTVEETETELDETDSNEIVLHFSKLDIMDDKCLENIKMIVEAGQIEKLKVDQCKMYLRKNGLRLSGNKDTLVKRIKEHLEILNAGGEKKYPVSSFVLNCTGDACTGDVVMFEQNVYEMFNIASRSATGPPCGTRTIVGRIVKEGYGASKQQHTFTIEVLWSKGTKPLPPLYPLLIKGRNLYRIKTLRQRWENEGDRQRVLLEKHSRGYFARSARETRVLEKEKRKMLKKNRVSRKEGSNATLTSKTQQAAFIVSDGSRNSTDQQSSLYTCSTKVPRETKHGNKRNETRHQTRASQNITDNIKKNGKEHYQTVPSQRNFIAVPPPSSKPLIGMNLQSTGQPILQGHMQQQYQTVPSQRNFIAFPRPPSRPLKGMSLQSTGQLILQGLTQQQYCRHYVQGRCYYGENCKFSHDISIKCVTATGNRGPLNIT